MNLMMVLYDAGFIHKDVHLCNMLRAMDGSLKLIDLETVEKHRCIEPKRKGPLIRKALGCRCKHLVQVAKHLALL